MKSMQKRLYFLKKEIERLNEEINLNNNNNFYRKKAMLKGYLKVFTPYALAMGLSFLPFDFYGLTPFFRDDTKKYLNINTEIDNLGNVMEEKTYDNLIKII